MRQFRWTYGQCWLALGFCVTTTLLAADPVPEAATVEQAIKVLDLRTMELPDFSAKASKTRPVGSLTYEIIGSPIDAFKFQQEQLLKLGWKELPGTVTQLVYGSGMFEKANFVLAVLTSSDKPGISGVSITNLGNVPLTKLPLIKGTKPLFANEATAMYVSDLKPFEAAVATRKLFLDAGWEPYGTAGDGMNNYMQTFKQNAVQVTANANVAPAQDGKTVIAYSSLLLSADIPAPATAENVHYVDMLKTLRFSTTDSHADVAKFYQQALAKRGWKPTTLELITATDRFQRATGMQIFKNDAQDMISLDLKTQPDKNLVVVKHSTAAELADIETKAREAEEKLVAEKEAKKAGKPMPKAEADDFDALLKKELAKTPLTKGAKVAIPLPANAKKVDQTSDNVLQVKLPGGKGKAAAEFIRDQLATADWKLDADADLDDTSGNVTFKKGTQQITMTFVDTGVTDVTLMMIGIGAKLEPAKIDPTVKPPKK